MGGQTERQRDEGWGDRQKDREMRGGGSDSQKEGVDRQDTESGTWRNKERNRRT